MKKIFALLAVVALAAVGCDDKKTTGKPADKTTPTTHTTPDTTSKPTPVTTAAPPVTTATKPETTTTKTETKKPGGDGPSVPEKSKEKGGDK